MRAASLLLIFLAVSHARVAHADEPVLPAALRGAQLSMEELARAPSDVRTRRAGRRRVGHSPDRQTLYEWTDSGVRRTTIAGATLPRGTLLLPIRDLDTVRFASLPPDGYALLLPGSPNAWVFDFMWSEPFAIPLERAVPSMPDRESRRASVVLRAMRSCPRSRRPCALHGPVRDVARARDPDEPMGGFFLRRGEAARAPAGLHYESVRHATTLSDVSIRVDTARTADNDLVERVFLVVGGAETHAFTAIHRGVLSVSPPALAAIGERLYVLGDRASVHERRTGRLIRREPRVYAVPYYDVCLAGDDGIYILPVPRGGEIGYALLFAGSDAAIYYRSLSGPPRRVRLEGNRDLLYGLGSLYARATPTGLRLATGTLRRL